MAEEILKFPEGFTWGVSTSAHQVEGGNQNDWTEWELQNAERLASEANPCHDYGNGKSTVPRWGLVEAEAKDPANYVSGDGVDHWERWQEDIDIASELGVGALRFSVEWSRVEPSQGDFDESAIDHYRQVAEYCSERGLSPMITLHHFTNPQWAAKNKSWERREMVDLFDRYVRHVVERMPDEGVDYLVINEPEVFAGVGYMMGQWPPQRRNPFIHRKVIGNLTEAHKRGYDTIKDLNDEARVSSAVNNMHFDPESGALSLLNRGIARLGKRFINHGFHRDTMDHQDFIGLNHYMHNVVNGGVFKNPDDEPSSDLGWYLNPESMYHVLADLAQYDKPIIITENGLADASDQLRPWYMTHTLQNVHRAITDGIDVQGYFHWSLLDNFEWDKGYWPKFGLVEVDRSTMERKPRASAELYAQIATSNAVTVDAQETQ